MRISRWIYRVIRGLVWFFYPKMKLSGEENLPSGPCVIVANHSKMNGPIASELYTPGKHAIWCAGEMMHLKEVPAYAYRDFWSAKPRSVRWFYRVASYLIAPVSVCVFNNAGCIATYHDARVLSTFKETIRSLRDGTRVVIFPEHDVPYNHILCDFQDRFVDLGRMYHRATGEDLLFVPLYIAPRLRTMYYGEGVAFDSSAPAAEERTRICRELMDRITDLACTAPEHTVVPYPNVPRREYPKNLPPRKGQQVF